MAVFFFEANCGGCGRRCNVQGSDDIFPKLRCGASGKVIFYGRYGKKIKPPTSQEVDPDNSCDAWIPDGPLIRRP